MKKEWWPICLIFLSTIVALLGPLTDRAAQAADPELARDFELPLPLFATPGSAWVENATAVEALPENDQQILTYYRVLCGDGSDLVAVEPGDRPILDVAFDEFTLPIFLAGNGQQSVDGDGDRP